jgi:hypothetical protein
MAQPLGTASSDHGNLCPGVRQCPVLTAAKKKSCKQKKCSNWKGGKCRCGRD